MREQEVCRKDWLALLLWSQGREGLLEEIESNAFAGLSTVCRGFTIVNEEI